MKKIISSSALVDVVTSAASIDDLRWKSETVLYASLDKSENLLGLIPMSWDALQQSKDPFNHLLVWFPRW